MDKFGGDWTEQKIEIVVEYTKAYLTIMNKYPQWRLLYFDGFAGSGQICSERLEDTIEGVARRILGIDTPKSFDLYYFVEKKKKNVRALKRIIKNEFPQKENYAHVVSEDCNKKLKDLADYLNADGSDFKVLAFIDPCGMQLQWSSLEAIEGFGIDMWILVPIGIGPNRLLKKNGDINYKWMEKLVNFLGMNHDEIHKYFYLKTGQQNIFNNEDHVIKTNRTIEKLGDLYRINLKKIFSYVSKPFVMKNRKNNVMYHFLLGSNNMTAVKIANKIVGKWSQ